MSSYPRSPHRDIPPIGDAAVEALLAGSLPPADADAELRPLAEAIAALRVAPGVHELAGEPAARAAYRGRVRPPRPAGPGKPQAQARARFRPHRQSRRGCCRGCRRADQRCLRGRAACPGAKPRAPHPGRTGAAHDGARQAASRAGLRGHRRRWPLPRLGPCRGRRPAPRGGGGFPQPGRGGGRGGAGDGLLRDGSAPWNAASRPEGRSPSRQAVRSVLSQSGRARNRQAGQPPEPS